MAEQHPFFAQRNTNQGVNRSFDDYAYVELKDEDLPNYFFGRLIWNRITTYKEIESWLYDMEDINIMHDILDLKERIDYEVAEKSRKE